MDILEKTTSKNGHEIKLIGTKGEGKILVIGVFHGEEPQGKFLIDKYIENNGLLTDSPSPHPSPRWVEGAMFEHSHNYNNSAKNIAKVLRENLTDAEAKLWSVLRRNNVNGYHFKRQKPIGKYVVDFVCLKRKLIIELDGSQHYTRDGLIYDAERTEYLENLGYKVIRIPDNEILNNIEGSVEYIIEALSTMGRGEGRGANLLFIPCLNPDGMAENKRTNANGVDLNRNYPTKNWELTEKDQYFGGETPASEIETQFMVNVLEKYKPKAIVALHAPYKIVNYDGPAQNLAQKISEIIKYPVEGSIGYPTPGSFGTYCGVERNIPTITLELDEECPVEDLIKPVHDIFDMLGNL